MSGYNNTPTPSIKFSQLSLTPLRGPQVTSSINDSRGSATPSFTEKAFFTEMAAVSSPEQLTYLQIPLLTPDYDVSYDGAFSFASKTGIIVKGSIRPPSSVSTSDLTGINYTQYGIFNPFSNTIESSFELHNEIKYPTVGTLGSNDTGPLGSFTSADNPITYDSSTNSFLCKLKVRGLFGAVAISYLAKGTYLLM